MSSDVFRDFNGDIFDSHFYPLIGNDMNNFDELCLKVGWDEYINVHTWNNKNFKKFIKDIKEKKDTEFAFLIEEIINDKWVYNVDHNNIKVNIWDYGELYDTRCVTVNENILNRLENVASGVDKFVV